MTLQGSEARLEDPSSVQKGEQLDSIVASTAGVVQNTQPSELHDKKMPGQNNRLSEAAIDLSRKTGDVAVYGMSSLLTHPTRADTCAGYYINAVGHGNALLMTACTATYSFCLTFSQYVLRWATESSLRELNGYMGLYAGISFIAWAATSGTMWSVTLSTNLGSLISNISKVYAVEGCHSLGDGVAFPAA